MVVPGRHVFKCSTITIILVETMDTTIITITTAIIITTATILIMIIIIMITTIILITITVATTTASSNCRNSSNEDIKRLAVDLHHQILLVNVIAASLQLNLHRGVKRIRTGSFSNV